MAERQKIWVVAEQQRGQLAPVSLEVLGQAARLVHALPSLTGEIAAVIIGHQVESLAEEISSWGADIVYAVDDLRLGDYQNDSYTAVLQRLVEREKPDILLFGATSAGEELAPTLAARLNTGLAAHCTGLELNAEGQLVMMVPAFGGRVLGEIFCPKTRPQMASIKPGTFNLPERRIRRAEDGYGKIIHEDALSLLIDENIRLQTVDVVQSEPSGLPLEKADAVIAGGYGVGSKANWSLLEQLAAELQGAVGSTRPALDEGWTAGEHTMIGTSGKTVRPKVYLGFGISGAAHHAVGIKDAGIIINVNRDASAPALSYSDYYVQADAKKLAEALLVEIRHASKKGQVDQ